jgi:hypothetical protein
MLTTNENDTNETGTNENVIANKNDTNIIQKKRIKRIKKINNDILIIPTYESYNPFLSNKYTSIQLKQICKHYKLHVTGNKQVLTNVIYKHLYLSHYASILQNFWRKHYTKRFARLHGPAQFKRHLCVNETDFFTMDDLKDIPYTHFFSFKDSDNMIYGFDIMSLYNLIVKNDDNNVLNPYTRNPLSHKIKKDFKSLLYLSKILKEDIPLTMNEPEGDKIELNNDNRAISLFHEIDTLGHYTNPIWFLDLERYQLIIYIRELYDIWTYRAQLSDEIKYEICPNGNPFSNINMGEITGLTLRELQNMIFILMEKLIRSGINQNSHYLGSTYVLCALTLVNSSAAQAMPWLYESVSHF